MDSPQSVVSPFKKLSVSGIETDKHRRDVIDRESTHMSNGTDKKRVNNYNQEDFMGVLNVYVHQARDIHNICIYHKQDVYAKLCLTSDPENAVSTQTVNGGGRNPVFNDNVTLNVRTIECSLKCEIWMLSRVRNYLEDQLLGFALVPLSEILIKNGKVEKEFSLSSTDLFHTPAGFVQLTVSYTGSSPDVIVIPKIPTNAHQSETEDSVPNELDNIEFPDPKIVSEDQMMVSEYFSQNTESLISSEAQIHEVGVVESKTIPSAESPSSSVSTNRSQSSETQATSKSPTQEQVSSPKDKKKDVGDGESESSNGIGPSKETIVKPLVTINIEPEEKLVQQDIVDMYLKSMQQFTDSLAKMKLPLDLESNPTNSDNSSSDRKSQTPKSTGSRVFYGSRAFF